jgi:hypothetical protein
LSPSHQAADPFRTSTMLKNKIAIAARTVTVKYSFERKIIVTIAERPNETRGIN